MELWGNKMRTDFAFSEIFTIFARIFSSEARKG